MSVQIDRKDDSTYYVNDKLVRKDTNGNWVCPFSEITPSEHEAFFKHLKSTENES
ncbi:MAG: hypothetical protein U1C58_06165 [Flavobacteriaceae bacterium]|nr:hypothetical protein [Flavobacteriaceae bacterium]MDZ4147849.1 hypothetical protein [Flavobacteriaceae bacterium]